jgi:surface antigen
VLLAFVAFLVLGLTMTGCSPFAMQSITHEGTIMSIRETPAVDGSCAYRMELMMPDGRREILVTGCHAAELPPQGSYIRYYRDGTWSISGKIQSADTVMTGR